MLAKRHGYALTQLEALAVRSQSLCAICVGPMPTPRLYHVDRHPIALLCGRCLAAIENNGGDLLLLRRHRRFDPAYIANRGRLTRFIELHSNLPDDVRLDPREERQRLKMLEEDQPYDPLVEENVLSFPTKASSGLLEDELSDGEREAGDDTDEQRVSK